MAANKTSLSAGRIIRDVLLGDTDVTAITSHVFPVTTDKAKLPYIFYRRVSMEGTAVKGYLTKDGVQIEVLCCTEDYDSGLELAEAVRAALDGAQAEVDGLKMRSCVLADSEEGWQDDAFVQQLIFVAKIS